MYSGGMTVEPTVNISLTRVQPPGPAQENDGKGRPDRKETKEVTYQDSQQIDPLMENDPWQAGIEMDRT